MDDVEVNPRLARAFCRDAEKAVAVLRETVKSTDTKLYTTTAHAMKSALANIGNHAMSEAAAALEKAGKVNDYDYISAYTEAFLEALESLIESVRPQEASLEGDKNITEDTTYLREQLLLVISACEDYNDKAAFAALDRLGERTWKAATANTLEEIRDILFVISDFDAVAEMAKQFLLRCEQ